MSWTAATEQQLTDLLASLRSLIGPTLIGIYLHGSLAMGGFQPGRSDVDLLVVVQEALPAQAVRRLTRILRTASGAPHPLELSVLTLAALHPWRHPTPFAFHYSESWRQRFQAAVRGLIAAVLEQMSPGNTPST